MKLEKNKDKLRQVVSESTLTQSELSELQEKLDYGLRRFGDNVTDPDVHD